MALDRTRLAHERTLMAWVRTSASLISFGFTLHKFFQFMRESQSAPLVHHAFGPREFALMMMGIGLTVLLVATLQHQRDVQQLRAKLDRSRTSLALCSPPSSAASVSSASLSCCFAARATTQFHGALTMRLRSRSLPFLVGLGVLLASGVVRGQAPASPATPTQPQPGVGDARELANQVSNPAAPLTLLQFRDILFPSVEGTNGATNVFQIQPVLPMGPSLRCRSFN